MKRHSLLLPLCLIGAATCTGPLRAQEPLERSFQNPPASARPHTWWHWMNGNISKAGITADLAAMKRAGIGGAQIFNVDVGLPDGATPFMSPQWREAMQHAAKEANRFGIELCLHNCAGWSSSGGPWIKPEYSMQILTWSETPVRGPMRYSGTLRQPASRQNYYRDIAVFAVRKPPGEQDGQALRIKGITAKAAFERGDSLLPDNSPTPEGMATPRDGVIIVSERPTPDGKLAWDVPEGEWTLIRLGHTTTGKDNHPAPVAGRGLECDKLSREAMDVHWAGMMATVLKDIGPLAGKTINNALIDSYEVGSQNWTPKFREEFRKRRGYDPLPWMPVVTGRVVDTLERSERFLWDFRRTICDLFADNYFTYFAELCHKHGLRFSVEPYGNGSFDNLQVGGLADIPMGEFWVGGAALETTKVAASAAHTNGRPVVGAESFTADDRRGRWLVDPYSIKTLGDRIFTLGINRYIFHRYAHQPWMDLKPGMTMGPWGMHLERTVTWWDQGAAWLRYVARCQYLLQSGRFVADVLYFTGDSGPNDLPFLRNQTVPFGYDYDGCDVTVLQKATVENGQIVLPSGMRYRLLVLPDTPWMTPATLRKIADMVQAGATVLGTKPDRSPSLTNYPACDAEVQQLADTVWGPTQAATTVHNYGKGRVLWAKTLAEAVKATVPPDVISSNPTPGALVWIHRLINNADVYFVANQRNYPQASEVSFRVQGRRPELWHPETGLTELAPVWREEQGRIVIPMRFGPAESVFVVFRQPSAGEHLTSITRPDASATPDKTPRIEIKEAYYEATDGAGKTDVTQKVAEMVAAGEMLIPATNQAFGDPTPLHVKRLRVVYLLNGKRMEQTVDENETLELGSGGSDTILPEMEVITQEGGPRLWAWADGAYEVTTSGGARRRLTSEGAKPLPIMGEWTVRFPPNLGAPPQITLSRLLSWSEHEQPGVRYFSGTATYETTFDVPNDLGAGGKALVLDLGRVKNFAEVQINGKKLATLWKAPFRQEVTGLVKPGRNTLTVRVTNLWPNRLIGDEQLADEVRWNGEAIAAWPDWLMQGKPRPKTDRIAFTTWRFYRKDSPLLESGLLGPVTLYAVPVLTLSGR